ncbi:MAG: nucleoside triphosphate pyrophosphohydrolase [Chloroflexota bacterium]
MMSTNPEDLRNFDTFRQIISRLRGPGGCPWDRKQTHESLKRFLIEECYEAIEVLDEGDSAKLCEELGDILLQIFLHAQIASEAGEFDIHDVIQSIASKMVYRHPHVFGDAKVADEKQVAENWEALKREERDEGASLLSSVPKSMPALSYSQAVQRRAARVGFDWKDFDGVLEKVCEELRELREASDQAARLHEFGDLLFAIVNAARWLDIDPEEALRLSNARFRHRFQHMEEVTRKRGVSLSDLSLDELDALWKDAKSSN